MNKKMKSLSDEISDFLTRLDKLSKGQTFCFSVLKSDTHMEAYLKSPSRNIADVDCIRLIPLTKKK